MHKLIPEEISRKNKRPVAVAPEKLTVKYGEEFEIDDSNSYDPEKQSLTYRWNNEGKWLNEMLPQTDRIKLRAPDKPDELEYKFGILDGIRCSEPVKINC